MNFFGGEQPGFSFQVFGVFSTTAPAAGASVGRFLARAFLRKNTKKLSTSTPVAINTIFNLLQQRPCNRDTKTYYKENG